MVNEQLECKAKPRGTLLSDFGGLPAPCPHFGFRLGGLSPTQRSVPVTWPRVLLLSSSGQLILYHKDVPFVNPCTEKPPLYRAHLEDKKKSPKGPCFLPRLPTGYLFVFRLLALGVIPYCLLNVRCRRLPRAHLTLLLGAANNISQKGLGCQGPFDKNGLCFRPAREPHHPDTGFGH